MKIIYAILFTALMWLPFALAVHSDAAKEQAKQAQIEAAVKANPMPAWERQNYVNQFLDADCDTDTDCQQKHGE